MSGSVAVFTDVAVAFLVVALTVVVGGSDAPTGYSLDSTYYVSIGPDKAPSLSLNTDCSMCLCTVLLCHWVPFAS